MVSKVFFYSFRGTKTDPVLTKPSSFTARIMGTPFNSTVRKHRNEVIFRGASRLSSYSCWHAKKKHDFGVAHCRARIKE